MDRNTGANSRMMLDAREELVRAAEGLASAANDMGDELNAAGLHLLIPRLRQGLVRVAVIGATSSGKSALINAMLGRLVVPENPNVSSPIPVWIGYREGEPAVKIYKSPADAPDQMQTEDCSIETFQVQYCYNAEHFRKRDEDHFSDIRYGAVSVSSGCLQNGAVFIDTLGIAASAIDTAKTHGVLEEGVDLVLFVTKNNSFTSTERDFIQDYLLGVRPEKHQVYHPVAPRNILFAVNPFGLAAPDRTAVESSIREVLAPCGLGDKDMAALLRDNVFYINALKGRYAACGSYPYAALAPAGSTERDKKSLARKQADEEDILSCDSKEQLWNASGVGALLDGLASHVRRQSFGADSAVVRRIRELSSLAGQLQLAASNRLTAATAVQSELNATKSVLAVQESSISREKTQISKAVQNLQNEYISAMAKVYSDTAEQMEKDCVERARNYPMPQDFDVHWNQFRHLDDQRKQQYLELFLPGLKDAIQARCIEVVLSKMDVNDPGLALEKTRGFIQDTGKSLNAYVQGLKDCGANALGIPLPTQESIEALNGQLRKDLEDGVSGAIRQSIADAGSRFQQKMTRYIRSIRWGMLGLFDFLPHGKAAFWDRVRQRVFVPLAEQLAEEVAVIAKNADEPQSALAVQISGSFSAMEGTLRDNLTSLLTLVTLRVTELEGQIARQERKNDGELARYEALKERCQALIQELNEWSDRFLNMAG